MDLSIEKPFDLHLKKTYTNDIIGLEIGVQRGIHAKNLLNLLPNLKMLYLVDPYTSYRDNRIIRNSYPFYTEFSNNILSTELNKRIQFIRKPSSKAINDIPDNLDFVYIDGNHSYDYVKNDIDMYSKKVKIDGTLGGDDYKYPRFDGVTQAVDEYVEMHNIKLNCMPYKMPTVKTPKGWIENWEWWVVKNE